MTVDIEALITSFLRTQPDVVALAGDRVYTDLPHERTWPLVLVIRVGGTRLYKQWLEAIDVEIATYGGSHKQAYNLAQACMQCMSSSMVGAHAEGVVTKVTTESVAYEPDAESADKQGHARPRYVVGATVTAHP